MSFAHLSWGWVLAGAAGLAALLYALQRLRIRHQPVTVVTTLFWRVAAEEAPARTFRERFRHPWAYALILLISLLLWLAFAGPRARENDGGVFHVLVLDGSAGMAAGSRFDEAVAALGSYVRGLPASRRQVIWSGAGFRGLLNPGEHELLLEKRLRDLRPEAAPSGLETLLRQLGALSHSGSSTEVVIIGDAPVRAETLALTPGLRVARAPLGERAATPNAGVTALGAADAASGAWDRVDVFFRVENNSNSAPATAGMAVDIDGRTLSAGEIRAVGSGSADGFLLSDVPASGGLLRVRLTGDDALALDNIARIRLPEKPRIKVQLSPSLHSALRLALEADPAIQITDTGAAIAIRRQGEDVGAGLPALEFVRSGDGQPAFLITHPEALDSNVVFNRAVTAIGLKEIDSMALAETAGRPIEVSIATGPQWRFEVWQDLLSDEFNFTQSRSFPLFMANAARWLANSRAAHPYVAAGRPLASESLQNAERVVSAEGRMLDPLGVAFVPSQAGELKLENLSKPLAVSLLDPVIARGQIESATLPAASSAGGLAANPAIWVLLAALALLMAEWYWHQTGRVP